MDRRRRRRPSPPQVTPPRLPNAPHARFHSQRLRPPARRHARVDSLTRPAYLLRSRLTTKTSLAPPSRKLASVLRTTPPEVAPMSWHRNALLGLFTLMGAATLGTSQAAPNPKGRLTLVPLD